MKVIFSTPDWTISGVNSFNHNLMRGLQAAGHDVELLVIPNAKPSTENLPLPTDVPTHVLEFDRSPGFYTGRWNALIQYLNGLKPCIYLPGYDFANSGVAPCLDREVGIVGVVHSDDPYHYEHLIRLGRYWNATVAVSSFIMRRMVEIEPIVTPTSHLITYGVPCPPELPVRDVPNDGPLRIVYSGRFYELQKRVSDLPRIAHALARRGVPAEWTLIGSGVDEPALRAAFATLPAPGRVTFTGPIGADAVLSHYLRHDCFILTSNFEGLPLSLLEAMAHATIPVVTDIASGIPDVVQDGVNGFRRPVGDVEGFADCLAALHADRSRLAGLSRAAYETIRHGSFSMEAVTGRYIEVFEMVRRGIADGSYQRPRPFRPGSNTGDVLPPPSLQLSPDLYFNRRALARASGLSSRLVRSLTWLRERLGQPVASGKG